MSTQHTPGPWTAKQHESSPRKKAKSLFWSVYAKGPVTQVYDSSLTATGQLTALAIRAYREQEVEANARLIAAAPDLLEALERLVKHGHNDDCNYLNFANAQCNCGASEAEAAISKAKGGQQ